MSRPMKAERRHELQQNTLDQALTRAPEAARKYGGMVLLILLAAVVFSGVAAAIMSTVNSFMNVGAAALIHDLPVALGRRVRNELLWGRIATVGISLLAAVLAQLSGTLVAFLGIFGFGLFAALDPIPSAHARAGDHGDLSAFAGVVMRGNS